MLRESLKALACLAKPPTTSSGVNKGSVEVVKVCNPLKEIFVCLYRIDSILETQTRLSSSLRNRNLLAGTESRFLFGSPKTAGS